MFWFAPRISTTKALPRTLDRLTSLRAVAALAVFAHHSPWNPTGLIANGEVGVAFFFVLSGFVLVWSAPAADTAVRFFRRRFARIYPSHLVVVILAALAPTVAFGKGIGPLLASLSLTQAWLAPKWTYVYGYNGVSWTLSCEAFFYAAFPIAFLVLRRSPVRTRWMLALAWFAAASAVIVIGAITGATGLPGVDPLIRFPEFLLGMCAAMAIQEGWRPSWTLPQASIGAIVLLLVVGAVGIPEPVPSAIMTLPLVAVIAAAATADVNGTRSWLTTPWAIYAGQVSFCFYLVHQLVLLNVGSQLGMSDPATAAVSLAIAAVAAVALHELVEKPAQAALRGKRSATQNASAEPVQHAHSGS